MFSNEIKRAEYLFGISTKNDFVFSAASWKKDNIFGGHPKQISYKFLFYQSFIKRIKWPKVDRSGICPYFLATQLKLAIYYYVSSVSKKRWQSTVLYDYYELSPFFLKQTLYGIFSYVRNLKYFNISPLKTWLLF